MQVADVLQQKGDVDEAVPWLEGVNALVPNDARVLARLGSLHASLGNQKTAIQFLQQAQRAAPQDADVAGQIAQLSTLPHE